MPDNTSSNSQPLIGMVTDTAAIASKKGSWRFALNTNVESLDGQGLPIPQNEHSSFLNIVFPAGFIVICNKYIKEQDRVIYFLVNPTTGVSQIGEAAVSKCYIADTADRLAKADCEECGGYQYTEPDAIEKQAVRACGSYYPIVVSECLGFHYNYPIDMEYQLTNCELRMYFTDGYGQRRFLYCEYTDNNRLKPRKEFMQVLSFDTACNAPIYSTIVDCNKMLVQPKISRGCVVINDVITGGGCQAGCYQFFTAYADVNGNELSEYSPGTNQVPIHRRDVVIQDDYITDKGILLGIVGLDYSSYYRYYNISVAKLVNGQLSFYKVVTLPIGVRSYFYTDNVSEYTTLDENAILKRPSYYKSAIKGM